MAKARANQCLEKNLGVGKLGRVGYESFSEGGIETLHAMDEEARAVTVARSICLQRGSEIWGSTHSWQDEGSDGDPTLHGELIPEKRLH